MLKTLATLFGTALLVLSSVSEAQQGGKRMAPAAPSGAMPAKQVPASDAGHQHRDAHAEGRMTPEQRQQLRRDVHKHGRDIYRDRPRPERQ
jgi:Spy/CpxP family protein refolding chaperone